MSATTSTNTKANKNGNKPSTLPQHDTQKSFTIIALTGFAGSLVGLSISRSRTRSAIALGAQLNDAAHSQAASLPIVFAISTAAFASIIEYSKILSPTRVLMGILREQGLIDDSPKVKDDQQQLWDDDCTATLGDYAIGGTIAGALFTGGSSGLVEKTLLSALQSPRADAKNISTNITFASGTDKQKSMIGKGKVVTLANKKILKKGMKRKGMIPTVQTTSGPTVSGPKFGTTPLPRPKIMSGLTTGLLLGLVAGVAQISLTKLEQFLQSQTEVDKEDVDDLVFGGERKDGSNEKPVWTQKQEEDLDDKIKNMSTEEIQREIDALRKRFQ